MTALPRPRRVAIAVLGLFAGLELGYAIWAACFAHGPLGPRVGYGPDSAVYLAAARAPVWSRAFLAGPGPFGFPLVAKVCARNLRAIVLVQTVLAIGAWSLLATTVVAVLHNAAVRWVALIAILGVGASPVVLQWNAFITTESLSISTLGVVLALGLRLALRGTRRDVLWFVAGMAAFTFTRDTNALAVGVIAVIALALALRRSLRTRAAVVGVAGVLMVLGASALSNAAEPPRWFWPIGETVSMRLLADPGATRYLVDHGFPLDANTRTLPQRYIFVVDDVVHGRAYAPLRAWLRAEGRHVYANFLLTHPGFVLRKPFDDRRRLFGLAAQGYGIEYLLQPRGVYGVIGGVAVPRSERGLELWTLAVALALGWLCLGEAGSNTEDRRVRAGVVGLVLVLAIAGFYASWHGDALEPDRHAFTSAVQLRLALWIGTLLFVDRLASRSRRPALASDVGVPGDADLDREEHERTPAEEPLRSAGL